MNTQSHFFPTKHLCSIKDRRQGFTVSNNLWGDVGTKFCTWTGPSVTGRPHAAVKASSILEYDASNNCELFNNLLSHCAEPHSTFSIFTYLGYMLETLRCSFSDGVGDTWVLTQMFLHTKQLFMELMWTDSGQGVFVQKVDDSYLENEG